MSLNAAAPAFIVKGLSTVLESRNGMRRVLDDVDLTVMRGRSFAILGESGSGKTSLVTSVLGLHPGVPGVVAGKATVLGVDVMPEIGRYVKIPGSRPGTVEKDVAGFNRELRRKWGAMLGSKVTLVPQDASTALSPFHNVGKLLTLAVQRGEPGLAHDSAKKEARRWLDRIKMYDVDSVMKSHVFELSGGMAQRVAIALALAPKPEILVADEPTTGLDATLRIELIALMAEMVREGGATLILVTHDNGAARLLADDVAVLYDGMIVELGPVDEVLRVNAEPKHPYTRFLLEAESKLLEGAEIPRIRRELAVTGGCPYAAFCSICLEICRNSRPVLRSASGHLVACWAKAGEG